MTAIAALVLTVIASVLIVHKQYEDGFIGRLALGFMLVMGLVVAVVDLSEQSRYAALPELRILLLAVDAFMARHLWRFLRWAHGGQFAWPRSN